MLNTHVFKSNTNGPPTFQSTALGNGGEFEPYHTPSVQPKSVNVLRFDDERYAFDIDVSVDQVVINLTATGGSNTVYSIPVSRTTIKTALDSLFSGVVAGGDVQSSLTYAASIAIDFNADVLRALNLTGNITFAATTNKATAKSKVIKILCDGTARTFAFPASWIWIGDPAPTGIAANKTGILSLQCWGTLETDITASYSVQL